jgi:hypothetical protein
LGKKIVYLKKPFIIAGQRSIQAGVFIPELNAGHRFYSMFTACPDKIQRTMVLLKSVSTIADIPYVRFLDLFNRHCAVSNYSMSDYLGTLLYFTFIAQRNEPEGAND